MRSEQIYPDVRTFESIVTGTKDEQGYWVTLQQSYFYPESGGQPADRGTLNGIPVLDVQLEDGHVWHRLESPLLKTEVQGEVDDVIRTDHAAQHTAQHVISAILQDEFQIKTISFRTGTEESTLDLNLDAWDDTLQGRLEERLRTVIQAKLPITATEYTEEAALQLPLRKTPQVTGKIRVVQIGELDYSACGGTHMASTSELELILFTGLEKVRGNIRLAYVAKDRAFRLLTTERRVLAETARALSAKKDQVHLVVEELKQEQVRLNRQIGQTEDMHVKTVLKQILATDEPVLTVRHGQEDIRFSEKLLKALAEAGRTGFVWNETAKKLFMCSAGSIHLGQFAKTNLKQFNGRGGGSENNAQALFQTYEEAQAYVEALKEELHT
ncbi:alanyl-tRNA editing protein [Exiguobacterium sp. 17-1]|uniref:alanyl-tRNA editing protein n=1 Tax=Exiguobacterium sp. 17-1 TaxID=2931981 RepID=UPI001FFF79AE|nr:alanyl-tRNA editing protein [Exiguobacterium sp. 17-1]MCK2158771.1 alanyl-tRNA editing protein [Exiguobacterium sp. 17-1]